MAESSIMFRRVIEGIGKMIDVRAYLRALAPGGEDARRALAEVGLVGDLVLIEADVAIPGSGAVKASEIAAVLFDSEVAPPHRSVRVELYGERGDLRFSPLDLERSRKPRAPTAAAEVTSDP